jgi:hypothetical protein
MLIKSARTLDSKNCVHNGDIFAVSLLVFRRIILLQKLKMRKIKNSRLENTFMNAKKFSPTGTLIFSIAFLVGGCTTNNTTNPARSATEQLLLSTAADHALQSANLGLFENRKVFLDTNYFDSYDSKYALGTIRDALSRAGAILEDNATNSDIIVEARSGALSIDNSTFLVGIPSIGAPIPFSGGIQTPELAAYKSQKQRSVAKIALLAFARESRAHIYSSGPLDGSSHNNHYNVFFVSWINTDIPEKNSRKKAEHYQTWFPQYDPTNLPSTNSLANLHPVNPTFTNAPPMTPTNTSAIEM